MGIGVIQEGLHPFFYEDKLELEPIKGILRELKELRQIVGYDPIGDFGQRFFLIEPPEEVKVEFDKLHELERLINDINAHVIAPTFDQLKQLNTVIAITGEKHKRHAVWTVLNNLNICVVHRLCTDSETAQWLIQRKSNNS